VACGSSGRDDRAAGTGPLPIGAVIALTGNASVIGQDQRIGLEIARDYFQGNSQGKGPALELKIQDGGSDEATATNAFRSLIGANVVALIGPGGAAFNRSGPEAQPQDP
jgi:branched-chain amino acid transport system substrate-binding protein